MPKQSSITILIPENEKQILEDFCAATGRNLTDVLRTHVRSLVDELPYHLGVIGCGGNPLKVWMHDGRKLTEEQFMDENPTAYGYWKQAYERSSSAMKVVRN
jgi:hypothetical protein